MRARIKLEHKLQKLVMRGTDQFVSALSKEDPEKVKGFLKDLSEDERLSTDVRSIFSRIYTGMLSGKKIEDVMNENQNGVITNETSAPK